jgi:prepilin-type N-terminal cleavage/methylation domain-containing protein
MTRPGNNRGFSLIELLIVVAIILIIASIAIPNLLRARIAANEASASNSIRTINAGEISYQSTYPTNGYAATLANLGGNAAQCAAPSPASACLINNVLAQNGNPAGSGKSGYSFAATGGGATPGGILTDYYATGTPLAVNQTGIRSFCSFEDGVIRVDPSGALVGSRAACEAIEPLSQ